MTCTTIDSMGHAQATISEFIDVFEGIGLLEGDCKLRSTPQSSQ